MPFLPRIFDFNSSSSDESTESQNPDKQQPSMILEYRIRLPMTVDEHKIARLYAISRSSKTETGGGEGIEYVENIPFTGSDEHDLPDGFNSGQFTRKKIHLSEKLPAFVRYLTPNDYLDVDEKSWNAYPYCKTDITNNFMNDDFMYRIETYHFDADDGTRENAHNLPADELKRREVIHLDIADNSLIDAQDYKPDEDPNIYKSAKTGRGPLQNGWEESCETMCVYKLVSIRFKWWGLQNRAEQILKRVTTRIFLAFFRRLHCWTDEWTDLTMEEVRQFEAETKQQLDEIRQSGAVQGTMEQ
ncbi:phosphatidylinositol transfer protein alpha isoform-like [Tubulanus polymorphus]|uniref:phosphatidylinositol transfer protein alpha isoform-like n=1 Tax=Tubulanus polymorphus TaxID=672921 RepID=UPI003DA5EEB0